MEKVLRPYQAEAVNAVLSEWESGKRATLLVLPMGCGKTFTASEIIRRRLPVGRVLWVAHTIELIDQARDAIQRTVGSDINVGVERGMSRARLYCMHGTEDRVIVGTVQTIKNARLEKLRDANIRTIIFDESHRATAASYRAIAKAFPDAAILGLTATPDRADGTGLNNVFESVAYEYSLVEAIRAGYLCQIRAMAVDVHGLDYSSVRTSKGDLAAADLRRVLNVDAVHHAIASPLVRLAEDRPTLVFCVTVEQSKALCDVIQGYLPEGRHARHVDGSTPQQARDRIVAEFRRGDVQFLTNVGVFTEGFDAPIASCVALARPTKSRALYAQMVGRCTRLFPGKHDGLVIDFRGNAGRHSLANPVDLLAGKELPPDVRRAAEKRLADGKLLDLDAMAQAEADHAKRLEEEDRKRAARAALQINAKIKRSQVDLFRSVSPGPRQTDNPCTEWQVAELERLRMKREECVKLSFDQAARQIDILSARAKNGKCSFPQARVLSRNGFDADISKQSASKIIDALVNHKWKLPPPVRQALQQLR